MKPYATYQFLEGTEMTDRDKKQIGSKFWNKGKWDNFVAPHLPESGEGLRLIDMGCNAGLFLKFAEDMGFKALGIDSNKEAVERGKVWRDKNGGSYEILHEKIENCPDNLPIVDYTVLANAHYYFTINDWINYVDKLKNKTRYVIIVTAEKKHINRCWASADVPSIRNYFKDWKEVSFVDELPLDGDPDPRRLWSLCFESPVIEKMSVDAIDSSNHVQDEFYAELDSGKHFSETKYYGIIKKYRKDKWSTERLNKWFQERVDVYTDLKKNGQKVPILIDAFKEGWLVDGNHRYAMLRTLGNKEVFVRKV
jgi:hypothetical protein